MKFKFLIYFILCLSILSLIIHPLSATYNNITYQIIQQNYLTILENHTNTNASLTELTYKVVHQFTNYSYTQGMNITVTNYNFTISVSKLTVFNGFVNVTVKNNVIKVYSGVSYLIRILVYSFGEEEIVWAGYLNSSRLIDGFGYINGSGTVSLQYLNGSKIVNINFSVNTDTFVSRYVNMSLYRILYVSEYEYTYLTPLFPLNIPIRYNNSLGGGTFSLINHTFNSSYTIGVSLLDGVPFPSMMWKYSNSSSNFLALEFFGYNGSLIGFVKIENFVNSTNTAYADDSYLTIFESNDIYTYPSLIQRNQQVQIIVGGYPVLLIINSYGVESTAHVFLSHPLYFNGSLGYLVGINVDNISRIVYVKNGNVINVSLVRPISVEINNVTIYNSIFLSQKILTSGLINNETVNLLCLSPINMSSNIVVLRQASNKSIVFLNNSDYFINNGKIYIFDDSSSVYFVVYNFQLATIPDRLIYTSISLDNFALAGNYLIIITVVIIVFILISLILISKRGKQ